MRSRRFISVIAIALLAPTGMLQPAFSHGGLAENRWNPAHLQNLPPEIRASVQKWNAACGGSLAAAQQFALYLTVPGAQFVALHFDDFRCGNKSVHCDATGCLHEVYVATNGRYRRVLTVHARDIRLISYQDTAAVEISAAWAARPERCGGMAADLSSDKSQELALETAAADSVSIATTVDAEQEDAL